MTADTNGVSFNLMTILDILPHGHYDQMATVHVCMDTGQAEGEMDIDYSSGTDHQNRLQLDWSTFWDQMMFHYNG